MKKIFTFLFAAVLFAACSSSGNKTESNYNRENELLANLKRIV